MVCVCVRCQQWVPGKHLTFAFSRMRRQRSKKNTNADVTCLNFKLNKSLLIQVTLIFVWVKLRSLWFFHRHCYLSHLLVQLIFPLNLMLLNNILDSYLFLSMKSLNDSALNIGLFVLIPTLCPAERNVTIHVPKHPQRSCNYISNDSARA